MVLSGLYEPAPNVEDKSRPAAHVIGKSSLHLRFTLGFSHVIKFLMMCLSTCRSHRMGKKFWKDLTMGAKDRSGVHVWWSDVQS